MSSVISSTFRMFTSSIKAQAEISSCQPAFDGKTGHTFHQAEAECHSFDQPALPDTEIVISGKKETGIDRS